MKTISNNITVQNSIIIITSTLPTLRNITLNNVTITKGKLTSQICRRLTAFLNGKQADVYLTSNGVLWCEPYKDRHCPATSDHLTFVLRQNKNKLLCDQRFWWRPSLAWFPSNFPPMKVNWNHLGPPIAIWNAWERRNPATLQENSSSLGIDLKSNKIDPVICRTRSLITCK